MNCTLFTLTLLQGETRNGHKHGYGVFTSSNGAKYSGNWRDGKKHGKGTYVSASGKEHAGWWKDDMPDPKYVHMPDPKYVHMPDPKYVHMPDPKYVHVHIGDFGMHEKTRSCRYERVYTRHRAQMHMMQ